jgi:hypothetical protein
MGRLGPPQPLVVAEEGTALAGDQQLLEAWLYRDLRDIRGLPICAAHRDVAPHLPTHLEVRSNTWRPLIAPLDTRPETHALPLHFPDRDIASEMLRATFQTQQTDVDAGSRRTALLDGARSIMNLRDELAAEEEQLAERRLDLARRYLAGDDVVRIEVPRDELASWFEEEAGRERR